MYTHLLYDLADGVATITLNRPDVYNALHMEMSLELQDAFRQAGDDAAVRVVVLTGAGKGFCSGQDLKAVQGQRAFSFSETVRKQYNPLILGMRKLPKPIIGRINGVAAGAGCSLALACDFLIAAEEAYFSELFVGIGLVLDSGSSFFLPRLVGSARAFEYSTMATKLSGKEAAAVGMINRAVPAHQLDAAVQQVAGYYAQAPTKTVGLIKQLLNRSYESSLETMLEQEAQLQDQAGATDDHREGVRAFLEKRPPRFQGH
ncbi:2-(1,2-epoxy-1,2-dihydrophenyl)acetyl-CoA isomerase [Catalinimonas alkaloidigena]|uniref:2-(1,2-epoxy-1,2-dihydrophenyl)acetyl-CoA isomerase n=1 Tax=Catalinimonas alkaloidigena TaxID=1075417 RepID=A0A1G9D4L0_9BACT|nr:enoyl-CoA hydratase-related protein [Catalinimonas alkaloidigena]SDK58811.1 2-(1,2-epoxy-1,2-dihydrophenyl)acetyl-CoA isomerase [Catalinimonas alkaloidigena]